MVEDVLAVGSLVYMATPAGLFVWDPSSQSGSTLTASNGLMGQSTWGLAVSTNNVGVSTLIVSHDGRGADRPGVSLINPSTQQVISTHRFDQLPSNTVTALEVWLLACMLLVFLSLVEYAVILRQIVIYKR